MNHITRYAILRDKNISITGVEYYNELEFILETLCEEWMSCN